TTTLTYRTALEKTPSIDPAKVKTDPADGLQSFELEYDGTTYTIKKLDGIKNDGGWWAVDASGDCIMHIEVTQNTDKSFCIKVPTNPAVPTKQYEAIESNVFNVSASGAAVTSAYHETNLEVGIKTSTDTVATVGGKDLTAYQYLALNDADKNTDPAAADSIYLLADTGELVFGSNVAQTLKSLDDIPGVDTISVKYDKSSFKEGDLRPEHYFDATQMDKDHMPLDPVIFDDYDQSIYYSVGTDQKIQININAQDLFDTQIIRQVDDILTAIEGVDEAEDKVNRIKNMQEKASSYSVDEIEKLSLLLDAANKELDIAKNKLQSVYESSVEAFEQFHYQATLAGTTCGTINNRLTLINNRLQEEQSTVKTLASENENVDITHVAIQVSDAEQIYNSALMATGKISQHSLLNYL
ncbi:MAG: hypothetical protein IK139_03600, partial [Lachnospiraceae bacterium]|nr:hypothetical protein [Lachnospiraceae bacterium]